MRIGIGYDSHRLVEGRKLVLGGVEIPHERGLLGYSDADVLCHAIIDAIIGAMGEGDIGRYFPDTDSKWKNASSIELLSQTINIMKGKGLDIMWIDSTVIAERPNLAPFIDKMKVSISRAGIPVNLMNIKAKTNEGMDAIGRGEGIAVQAVCLLKSEGNHK